MEAVDLLAERAAAVEDGNSDASDGGSDDPATDWVLGYGYDESTWDDDRYLTCEDLDRVSTERPVAAVREDMHVAAVNGSSSTGSRTLSTRSPTRRCRPTTRASRRASS